MRFENLASSSSGNSTYIGSDRTHILIDCGISKKRIIEGLHSAGIDLKDISAILITHEHTDHISALGVIQRSLSIPVYATEGTIAAILSDQKLGSFDKSIFNVIKADQEVMIGDMQIKPLKVSHDAFEPVCFRAECNNKSCAVVTDLGYYDDYLVDNLKGLDMIMVEANHDIRMLETGRYPYYLKQRIAGKKGHLSNEASGQLISKLLHDGVKEVILGHLSKVNNYPALAKLAVETEIDMAENKYKRSDFKIEVARPDLPLEITEV